MSRPRADVLDLTCPRCGNDLDGLDFDALFTCPECAIAVDVEAATSYPIVTVTHPEAGPNPLHLPIWCFPVELRYGAGEQSRTAAAVSDPLEAACRGVRERVRQAWVTAFACAREEYFGSPGLVRTRRQDPHPTGQPGERTTLVGIRRPPATAVAFVTPYVLALIDEVHDITGLEATVVTGPPRLLACPFADTADQLIDALTGLRYPVSALDDIDGIRAANQRRRG